MRETYQPGEGFPERLRVFLVSRGLRYSAVQRETGVHADTVSGWVSGKHYPEKHLYLQFCGRLKVPQHRAEKLLRLPGEGPLELRTRRDCQLLRYFRTMNEIDGVLPSLSMTDRDIIMRRIRKLMRSINRLNNEEERRQMLVVKEG